MEYSMKIRVEFLYNSITDKTAVYVWRGMRLLHSEYVTNKIDAYEADGIVERLKKEYKD